MNAAPEDRSGPVRGSFRAHLCGWAFAIAWVVVLGLSSSPEDADGSIDWLQSIALQVLGAYAVGYAVLRLLQRGLGRRRAGSR